MDPRAECQCGALLISSRQEPDFVIACNCRACQRRMGSVFGVVTYFRKNGVSISGQSEEWTRKAESGRALTTRFCPKCGSTVFWSLEMRPAHLDVASGCLVTRLPEPSRAIWVSEKHDWVSFPAHWPTFEFGAPEP